MRTKYQNMIKLLFWIVLITIFKTKKKLMIFTIILKKCTHALTNIETVIPKSYLI